MKIRLNKIIELLIESSVLLLIFFVPLAFSLGFEVNSVFTLSKTVLFKILVLCLCFLSFARILFKKKCCYKFIFKKVFLLKYFIIPLGFLLVLVFVNLFSVDMARIYYGKYSHQVGLSLYIYLFVFGFLLYFNIDSFSKFKRVLFAVSGSAFVVSAYGIMQKTGLDPLSWSESTAGRVSSTFGQPNLLASYLLLVMPVSFYLFLQVKRVWKKFFWIFLLLVQFACFVFTFSRGGIIALILVSFIFGGFGIFYKIDIFKKNKLKFLFGFLFALILSFSLIFVFFGRGSLDKLVDFKSNSVAVRIMYWEASMDAIKKRPLLGYGFDNQDKALIGFYEKDYAVYEKVNSYPDRAHNIVFDILLTGGFLALAAYIALLTFVFYLVYNNFVNKNNLVLSLVLFFGYLSAVFSFLFNFSSVGTDVYLVLYSTMLVLLNRGFSDKKDACCDRVSANKIVLFFKVLFVFIFGYVAFFFVDRQINIFISDFYFREMRVAEHERDYFSFLDLHRQSLEAGVFNREYDYMFAFELGDWLKEVDNVLYLELGRNELGKVLNSFEGSNYFDNYVRGVIYTALLEEKDGEEFNLAEKNLLRAINESDEIPQTYRALAYLYFKNDFYDKSVEVYKKNLSILPDLINPYMNPNHQRDLRYEMYLSNLGLGDVYFELKDYEKAQEYYLIALSDYEYDTFMYQRLANTEYYDDNFLEAIDFLKSGFDNNQSNYIWLYKIALVYSEIGDKDMSFEYAEKALKLSPESKRVEELIKELSD